MVCGSVLESRPRRGINLPIGRHGITGWAGGPAQGERPGEKTGANGIRKCPDMIRAQTGVRTIVNVVVRDNNVDQALRALKKKMQREGIFREMKLRRNYEKPSERRARERAEALRRHRKLMRKRLEREGY